jgi:hypothetical protein
MGEAFALTPLVRRLHPLFLNGNHRKCRGWPRPTPHPDPVDRATTANPPSPTSSDLRKANLTAPEPPPRGGRDTCRPLRAPSVRARSALHPGMVRVASEGSALRYHFPARAGVHGRSTLKTVHWTVFPPPREGSGLTPPSQPGSTAPDLPSDSPSPVRPHRPAMRQSPGG